MIHSPGTARRLSRSTHPPLQVPPTQTHTTHVPFSNAFVLVPLLSTAPLPMSFLHRPPRQRHAFPSSPLPASSPLFQLHPTAQPQRLSTQAIHAESWQQVCPNSISNPAVVSPALATFQQTAPRANSLSNQSHIHLSYHRLSRRANTQLPGRMHKTYRDLNQLLALLDLFPDLYIHISLIPMSLPMLRTFIAHRRYISSSCRGVHRPPHSVCVSAALALAEDLSGIPRRTIFDQLSFSGHVALVSSGNPGRVIAFQRKNAVCAISSFRSYFALTSSPISGQREFLPQP